MYFRLLLVFNSENGYQYAMIQELITKMEGEKRAEEEKEEKGGVLFFYNFIIITRLVISIRYFISLSILVCK